MRISLLRRLNRSWKPWKLSGRRVQFLLGCLAILAIEAATMASLPITSFLAPPAASAAPLAAPPNAIQIENKLPGDPTWDNFSSNLNEQMLSGYGSQTSIDRGQSIDFYVTTTAPSFQILIYRMGYYQGDGARLMENMGTFPGVAQPTCPISPTTGMVTCTNWSKTATLTVPSTWITGVYLAKLVGPDDSSFIIFVVRDDGGHEPLVFQTSVDTYEAYNTYGGTSLYNNLTDGSVYAPAHAVKVSFDRPFIPGDDNGAGQFLSYEYPFVRWAEQQGFDITYITNVDTSTGVNPLTNHKAFLSVGHDEYWSVGMRSNVQNAINAGVNVAFFSANTCYWQVRFEANSLGVANRVMVGYKDFADSGPFPGPDPELGVNNSIVTTNWRDPVVNMPENTLIGVMFEDLDQNPTSTYVVENASNWVYANTGFVNGSTVPGIVGYEYDKAGWTGYPDPPGLTLLSDSPVVGIASDDGGGVGNSFSNSSIYTAPSGAMVFASGTIEWSWGLDNWPNRSSANAGLQQTTDNILYRFTGTTPPPPPPPPPTGTYFTDNFETGDLSHWYGPFGTGTAEAESTVVSSGSYAAELTGSYTYEDTPLIGGAESLTYTRLYFQIGAPGVTTTLAEGTNVTGGFCDFCGTSTTSATTVSNFAVSYDAGRNGIDAYFWNGAGARTDLYSLPNIVAPGAWYGLEIEDNEAANGVGQIWLNGALILTTSAMNLSTAAPVNTLTIANASGGTTGTTYYDDIVVSNAYNGPVGGSYPGPAATVSPSGGVTFASQNVQTTSPAQAVTLTDSGTAPMTFTSALVSGTNASDFTATNTCPISIAVNGSCTIKVTFTPHGSGSRTATLTITDSAPGTTQTVTLTGTGVFPPPPADGIYFSDGFENGLSSWSTPTGPGQASVESTVVNSGGSALALTDASGQYVMLGGALIGGGETLTYTRFYFRIASPANAITTLAEGTDQDGNVVWVIVYDSARQGIDAYFWNGARTRFDLYSSTNIISPDTWYGLEVEDNETTTGGAQIWLNGTPIATATGDLSVTNGYSELTLMNTVTGTIYFDDVIISNKYNGPVGTGYPAPVATVSPTSESYGSQNDGTLSAPQTITVTDTGTLPLIISSTTVAGTNPGDFVIMSNTCAGATVMPTNSCSIAISFDPTAGGARSATLTIADNATGGTQAVSLTGTGMVPPPPPPPPDGVYFSDGFEGGNLSLWNPPSGSGQASIVTDPVHSGTYALALTNASGQAVSLSAGLIGGPETLTYTSFAFQIASASSTTTTIAEGTDGNGNLMWVIVYDSGRQGLDVYVWNGARTRYDLYSNQNVVSAGTWYTVELQMNETTTGEAELWLNGTPIATATGDLSTSNAYTQLTLMNQTPGTVYFDDVKVANVQ